MNIKKSILDEKKRDDRRTQLFKREKEKKGEENGVGERK